MRFNAPRVQNGPLIWAFFCCFGIAVAIWVMIHYPLGSDGWQAGLFLLGLVVFGLLAIEGWWLFSQREVIWHEGPLTVRRWSDALLRRDGGLSVRDVSSISLVFDTGKKIRIQGALAPPIIFWAATWSEEDLKGLLEVAKARGIQIATDW